MHSSWRTRKQSAGLRNGSLQPGEEDNTINLEELLTGEVFTCVVTNLAGEGRGDIVLNIAPTILSHPKNILTAVNQSVEFCCSISSYHHHFTNGSK